MRAWFLALIAAAATQSAGGPPQTLPPADLVRIDVIATDARGRAVENLKAADFELREDGVVQAIDDVRFVKVRVPGASAADPAPAVASADDERLAAAGDNTRVFGIYLDDYYVSAPSTTRVRDALHRFVDQDLGPGDLVT